MIGSPLHVPGSDDRPSGAAGPAVGIAAAAAVLDHEVQLVGRVGEDPAGDATLLALARSGIGHVAMLRDPAHATPVVPAPVLEDDPQVLEASIAANAPDEQPATGTAGGLAVATLDREDVELALRYLASPTVIVIAEALDRAALEVAADAAAFAGAALIVLAGDDGSPTGDLPDQAIVLGVPVDDPDGLFARTVGEFAAAIDAGEDPRGALETAVAALGWEPAGT